MSFAIHFVSTKNFLPHTQLVYKSRSTRESFARDYARVFLFICLLVGVVLRQ